MRERSGTLTEHANRRTPTRLTATAVATAACLVAAPSAAGGAAPVTSPPAPDEVDGPLQPGTPVVAEATTTDPVATTDQAPATTETEVREITVPDVEGAAVPGDAAEVVARVHRRSTDHFALVALTWRPGTAPDDVEVQVRTHGSRGWSRWSELHHHAAEGPAPGEESGVLRDGTEPLWVDDADGVQARVLSATGTAPADPQVVLVDPGGQSGIVPAVSRPDRARFSVVPAVLRTTSTTASATTAASSRPRLISRRQWGADPRLRSRCDSPRITNTLQMAFVHHTAGNNHYSRSEAPAIVRGVYAYHTQGQGWCDIGYNFLVDRFGRSYVGRAGGPNVAVRGAHSGDYNERTAGVSLIGNFEKARPTRAMRRGLIRLLAWKLGSFYRGPRTTVRIEGRRFEKISGHRDAMSTACPGRFVYRWLPRLRERVASRIGGVQTPISRKWKRLRADGRRIGQPFRGEADSANGGRKTQFGRGWILWNDRPGAHHVYGALYRRYRGWGLAAGRMGYPRTDAWDIRGHRGRAQTFQRGRIYRTPGNGAVGVWGKVNRRYRRTGLAAGKLGVPVRDQHRIRRGWAAGFEHGRITWNTSTGRTRVRTY
ncbi:MAG: N-acetylmuramoyl-L-alanine amidase [Actinomycetota bacterium]|nr:N-acetylmuramoyl-L-alanine amidase [Actinomycetota bacterium]